MVIFLNEYQFDRPPATKTISGGTKFDFRVPEIRRKIGSRQVEQGIFYHFFAKCLPFLMIFQRSTLKIIKNVALFNLCLRPLPKFRNPTFHNKFQFPGALFPANLCKNQMPNQKVKPPFVAILQEENSIKPLW